MAKLLVVRGRDAFAALSRRGRRAREGPLTVVHLAGGGDPRVAFAIGRRVGPAVSRNRLRRRLRALLRETMGDDTVFPGPGDYLVVAAPGAAELEPAELARSLRAALGRLAVRA